MAETGVDLFYIVIALIIVALVVVVIYGLTTTTEGGINSIPITCESNTNNIIDISGDDCCQFNNTVSSYKYIPQLDLMVAPFPTPYIQVCVGFCPTQDFNSKSQTCNSSNPVIVEDFDTCVKILKPNGCTGVANPIARSNGILYYGFEAGNASCTTLCNCNASIC